MVTFSLWKKLNNGPTLESELVHSIVELTIVNRSYDTVMEKDKWLLWRGLRTLKPLCALLFLRFHEVRGYALSWKCATWKFRWSCDIKSKSLKLRILIKHWSLKRLRILKLWTYALNTHSSVIALRCFAMPRACSLDSITFGPARRKKGEASWRKVQNLGIRVGKFSWVFALDSAAVVALKTAIQEQLMSM